MLAAQVRERRERLWGKPTPRQIFKPAPKPIVPKVPVKVFDFYDASFNTGPLRGMFGNEQFLNARIIPTVLHIVKVVAMHYGLEMVDMMSECRARHMVRARFVAMYLSRRLTPSSYPQIGRRLGDRDHTTIMHGIRWVEANLDKDEKLKADVAVLTARFTGIS